jgi:hypothetical protein
MLFLVQNRVLVKDREVTYLTAPCAAAATALTVKAIDNVSWADNDWLIVGEIGSPNAEVLQINGAVSDGTSLTVDNAGSGGARFAHAAQEPVYRIDYNKVRFFHSSTATGSKTTLTTVDLMPENFETRYEDTSNTSGFGFAAFFNSQSSLLSPYSDAIPYAGQEQGALSQMVSKVRTLINELKDDFVTDGEIVDAINDKQREILNQRLWTFGEIERTTSSVANQFEYAVSSSIKTLHTMRFRTIPLARIGEARWEMLHWNTNQTSSRPMAAAIWQGNIRIYPTPPDSAATTQLNGALSDSETATMTVDNASVFKKGDFYRVIIDSEVIYATGQSSTTLTGLLRGQEGTTAASHLDNATVTERDIVYAGQLKAVDLVEQNDVTIVPEPIVICYGAAADLCHGKLEKSALGDRYDAKFKLGLTDLENRFSLKTTAQPGRVKDPLEVITDNGVWRDPNDYPMDVTAP